jgi:hypothetical protein
MTDHSTPETDAARETYERRAMAGGRHCHGDPAQVLWECAKSLERRLRAAGGREVAEPVAWRFNVGGTWFVGTTLESCRRQLEECGLDSDIQPLYAATLPTEQPNKPIDKLLAEYAAEECDFTDMEWVRKTAQMYVERMPDSQVRCLLHVLAAEQGVVVPVEPTEEILTATYEFISHRLDLLEDKAEMISLYHTILAAAKGGKP